MESLDKNFKDLLFLLNSFVNSKEISEERLNEIDFKAIYLLASHHSLKALLGFYISKLNINEEVKAKFKEAYNLNVRRTLLFNAERANIYKALEDNNIDYLPLKGIIINDYYPSFGTREFADNDIYFKDGNNKAKLVRKIFKDNSYEVENFGKGEHDIYNKKPCFEFEMHKLIFSPLKKNFYKYYLNIDNMIIKDINSPHLYHLSPSDFYIYFIAHAYKHYSVGGNGLRFLVDTYFINKNLKDKFDNEYISNETKKLKIFDFNLHINNIVNHIFEGTTITDEEEDMLSYILNSGTYGTFKNKVNKGIEESPNKLVYVLKRVFPPYSWYKEFHPFIAKTFILIPFFPFYRLIKHFITKNKNAVGELKSVFTYKKEK